MVTLWIYQGVHPWYLATFCNHGALFSAWFYAGHGVPCCFSEKGRRPLSDDFGLPIRAELTRLIPRSSIGAAQPCYAATVVQISLPSAHVCPGGSSEDFQA